MERRGGVTDNDNCDHLGYDRPYVMAGFCGGQNQYRVTHQVEPNLPLTTKHKFRFCLAWPDLDWQKWNFYFYVNGRFGST